MEGFVGPKHPGIGASSGCAEHIMSDRVIGSKLPEIFHRPTEVEMTRTSKCSTQEQDLTPEASIPYLIRDEHIGRRIHAVPPMLKCTSKEDDNGVSCDQAMRGVSACRRRSIHEQGTTLGNTPMNRHSDHAAHDADGYDECHLRSFNHASLSQGLSDSACHLSTTSTSARVSCGLGTPPFPTSLHRDEDASSKRGLQRRPSWVDGEFGFLRSLLQESGGIETSSPAHDSLPTRQPDAAESMKSRVSPPTPSCPVPNIKASGAPVPIQYATETNCTGYSCEVEDVPDSAADEKLRAADDVATLLWRANDKFRQRLLARLKDTWATAEPNVRAEGLHTMSDSHDSSTASTYSTDHGEEGGDNALLGRLRSTRLTIAAELQAAVDAAASAGDLRDPCCNAPVWRGASALREDVVAKLEVLKAINIAEDTAVIAAAAAAGASDASICCDDKIIPHSNTSRRDKLLKRVQNKREAAVSRTGGAQQSSLAEKKFCEGDDDDDDRALNAIDRLTEGLLQELGSAEDFDYQRSAYRHAAKFGNERSLREGLLAQLAATRAAAEAELEAADRGSRARTSVSIPLDVNDVLVRDVVHTSPPISAVSTSPTSSVNPPQCDPAATTKRERKTESTASRKRTRSTSGGGRRCKHEGCSLHPHFGLTRAEYCSRHKLPGMYNVKGRRCRGPDCKRTPVYGNAGDPHPTFCATHKLAGMVDIKNPTCRDPTCARQPSFGFKTDKRATYCASHMLDGMVNVRRLLASRSTKVSTESANLPKARTAPRHSIRSRVSPSNDIGGAKSRGSIPSSHISSRVVSSLELPNNRNQLAGSGLPITGATAVGWPNPMHTRQLSEGSSTASLSDLSVNL